MSGWIISTLAQGAAISMTMQISNTEKAGFECSSRGLTVLAQIELPTNSQDEPDGLLLAIAGTKFNADVVYMLETKPRFWSGGFSNTRKLLPLLSITETLDVTVQGRTLRLELDKAKSAEFVAACSNMTLPK
jgi:hypothetical protein